MSISEHYVAVLKSCESEVASVLQILVDLKSFCSDLHRHRVISKREKQLLCSLDVDRIESSLVTKYLIQLICDSVKKDAGVWDRLVRVLSNGGANRVQVREILFKALEKVSEESNGAFEKHNSSSYFTEKDIGSIVEILTVISYKWEEISIALGLSSQARKNSESGKSNVISLTNVITEWMNQNPAKCTLQELKTALQTETVGGSRSAVELDKKFKKAACISKFSVDPESMLIIEFQSEDEVIVADGKSTLLGVQVNLNSNLVSFQWKKNGELLSESDSSLYSGVHCDTLAIWGCQGIEGRYSCVVRRGLQQVICEDIEVTVEYPLTKQHLLDVYSKYREVPVDSWPPTRTNKFITPTLFKCSNQCPVSSSHEREIVTYEEVFGEHDSGALVLVMGFAGSGKTTLSQKIVKDWAKGHMLRGAKLVIFIPLRLLGSASGEFSLLKVLKQIFHYPDCDKKQLLADIEKRNGEGVCFVLDGWDEYQIDQQDRSTIFKIVYKDYLPQSMVIVLSRTSAISDLEQKAQITLKLELVGFLKENLLEYIDRFELHSLKDYILSENHLVSMCSLPMHAAMICFIFQNEKGKIPVTETSLYECFTRLTVLRHLKRKNSSRCLNSLHDLKGKEKKHFLSLCKLAFNMTVSFKQVASQGDLQVPNFTDNDNALFGLIAVDHVAEIAGFEKKYSFFHVTIQEFLAAFYLLDHDSELVKLTRLSNRSIMLKVWKFYCGLTTWEPDMYCKLNFIFLQRIPHNYMFLYAMECAAESRQASVCDTVMRAAKGIALEHPLKSTHLSAIKYVLSVSSEPFNELFLYRHCTDEEGIVQFLSGIRNSQWKSLSSLTLRSVSLGSAGARAIAQVFQHCRELTKLDLSQNFLSSRDLDFVSQFKNCMNLSFVNLSHNCIDGDIKSFGDTCNSLKIVDLSFNKIKLDKKIGLVSAFMNTTETLYLHGNSGVTSEIILTLAEELNGLSHKMRQLHLDKDCKEGTKSEALSKVKFIHEYVGIRPITERRFSFSTYEMCYEVDLFNSSFMQSFNPSPKTDSGEVGSASCGAQCEAQSAITIHLYYSW